MKTTPNVRLLSPNKFHRIERIYAHHGVVVVVDKQGTTHHLTIRSAAIRAQGLLRAAAKSPHRNAMIRLAEATVAACKEAQQQTVSGDKTTGLVQNMLAGKTPSGQLIVNPFEKQIKPLALRFFLLSIEEIETLLRENLRMDVAMNVMESVHRQRLQEAGSTQTINQRLHAAVA